jgi:hypothetical protein
MNELVSVASCFIRSFTGGPGASSGVAFPHRACQLTYSGYRIWTFQGAMGGLKNPPHFLLGKNEGVENQ